MLITLLTIAIASLAATPLVAPAVRRFVQDKREDNHKRESENEGKAKQNNQSDGATLIEHEQLSTSESKKSPFDENQALPIVPPVIPEVSLELIKPKSDGVGTVSQPLVEVVWKSTGSLQARKDKKPKKDLVESFRPTPSADSLFEESQVDTHIVASVNTDDPPRRIIPKAIKPLPNQAKEVSPITFGETTLTETDSVRSKTYQVGSEKFKMRPVNQSAGSKKSTAIPMMMTPTPNAIVNQQHYEVIKPTVQKSDHKFSLSDIPEAFSSGEQAWLGVQPLYIDFSPFFSLDSLISISPSAKRKQKSRNTSVDSSSTTPARLSSQNTILSEQEFNERSINLLRDLNSEVDEYLYGQHQDSVLDHDEYLDDEEEYQWSGGEQDQPLDELEDLPEWQSLLGLSSNFLFDFKLSQSKTSAHQQLTEQKLEDAIVFKITSGPAGPHIETEQPKPHE